MLFDSSNKVSIEQCITALCDIENCIIAVEYTLNKSPEKNGFDEFNTLEKFCTFLSKIGEDFVYVEFDIIDKKDSAFIWD